MMMKIFSILALALLALHATDSLAAAGAGGSLPYEGWLTQLQNSEPVKKPGSMVTSVKCRPSPS
jgi:hypothetical protein